MNSRCLKCGHQDPWPNMQHQSAHSKNGFPYSRPGLTYGHHSFVYSLPEINQEEQKSTLINRITQNTAQFLYAKAQEQLLRILALTNYQQKAELLRLWLENYKELDLNWFFYDKYGKTFSDISQLSRDQEIDEWMRRISYYIKPQIKKSYAIIDWEETQNDNTEQRNVNNIYFKAQNDLEKILALPGEAEKHALLKIWLETYKEVNLYDFFYYMYGETLPEIKQMSEDKVIEEWIRRILFVIPLDISKWTEGQKTEEGIWKQYNGEEYEQQPKTVYPKQFQYSQDNSWNDMSNKIKTLGEVKNKKEIQFPHFHSPYFNIGDYGIQASKNSIIKNPDYIDTFSNKNNENDQNDIVKQLNPAQVELLDEPSMKIQNKPIYNSIIFGGSDGNSYGESVLEKQTHTYIPELEYYPKKLFEEKEHSKVALNPDVSGYKNYASEEETNSSYDGKFQNTYQISKPQFINFTWKIPHVNQNQLQSIHTNNESDNFSEKKQPNFVLHNILHEIHGLLHMLFPYNNTGELNFLLTNFESKPILSKQDHLDSKSSSHSATSDPQNVMFKELENYYESKKYEENLASVEPIFNPHEISEKLNHPYNKQNFGKPLLPSTVTERQPVSFDYLDSSRLILRPEQNFEPLTITSLREEPVKENVMEHIYRQNHTPEIFVESKVSEVNETYPREQHWRNGDSLIDSNTTLLDSPIRTTNIPNLVSISPSVAPDANIGVSSKENKVIHKDTIELKTKSNQDNEKIFEHESTDANGFSDISVKKKLQNKNTTSKLIPYTVKKNHLNQIPPLSENFNNLNGQLQTKKVTPKPNDELKTNTVQKDRHATGNQVVQLPNLNAKLSQEKSSYQNQSVKETFNVFNNITSQKVVNDTNQKLNIETPQISTLNHHKENKDTQKPTTSTEEVIHEASNNSFFKPPLLTDIKNTKPEEDLQIKYSGILTMPPKPVENIIGYKIPHVDIDQEVKIEEGNTKRYPNKVQIKDHILTVTPASFKDKESTIQMPKLNPCDKPEYDLTKLWSNIILILGDEVQSASSEILQKLLFIIKLYIKQSKSNNFHEKSIEKILQELHSAVEKDNYNDVYVNLDDNSFSDNDNEYNNFNKSPIKLREKFDNKPSDSSFNSGLLSKNSNINAEKALLAIVKYITSYFNTSSSLLSETFHRTVRRTVLKILPLVSVEPENQCQSVAFQNFMKRLEIALELYVLNEQQCDDIYIDGHISQQVNN